MHFSLLLSKLHVRVIQEQKKLQPHFLALYNQNRINPELRDSNLKHKNFFHYSQRDKLIVVCFLFEKIS